MSTITDRRLIDQLIADHGRYEDDPEVALIVEYTTFEGDLAWGVTWVTETPERQARYLVESPYVRAPKLIYSRHGEDPTPAAPPATPRRCGDTSPPEGTRERIGPYRCTLPAGHTGPHVMTSHPMHPFWPRS